MSYFHQQFFGNTIIAFKGFFQDYFDDHQIQLQSNLNTWATYRDEPNHDKKYIVQSFESANKQFSKLRRPSPHVSVDETLFPWRGRIGFKQYNPLKPVKYGILFRSLCESEEAQPYTYFSLPYAGKPEVSGSQYYITGTDNYTKNLVDGTIRTGGETALQACNISLDRYFTSMPITYWCLLKNITITGTMRQCTIQTRWRIHVSWRVNCIAVATSCSAETTPQRLHPSQEHDITRQSRTC